MAKINVDLTTLAKFSSLEAGTYTISVEAVGVNYANSLKSTGASFTKSNGYTVALKYDKNASDNDLEMILTYSDGSKEIVGPHAKLPTYEQEYTNVISITTTDYIEITENGITKSIQGTYMLVADVTIKRTLFAACIDANTLVTMADGTTKKFGEIEVGDEVLSIDYDTMTLISRKVIYSGKDEPGYSHWNVNSQWENVYCDGTVINQAMKHRFYNLENQSYVYLDYWNEGEHTYKLDGSNPYLVSRTLKQGRLNYARITLEDSNNYFANGLSTGDRNCCPNPVILDKKLDMQKKEVITNGR